MTAIIVTGLGYGFELRPSVVGDNLLVREIRMAGRGTDFPLAGYARNFLGKVLAPVALVLAYSEYRRRRVPFLALGVAGVAGVGQTLAFSAAANVSLLLAPLAVVAIIVVQRRPANAGGRTLLLGSGALVVAASSLAGIGWWRLQDDVVRRAFQMALMLTVRYFDFFDRNPVAYFEGSLIGRALDSGYYGELVPRLIGTEYGLPEGTHANANLFADAFGQLGVIGPIVVAIILAILFRLIGALAPARPPLVASVILMPAWSIADSGLLSAILSHGLLLALLLLSVAPEIDNELWTRARKKPHEKE